ncbi:MAG: hypothetical protein AAGC93_27195, partial [Cyanobacteria bacterium P01_F01_bin.53]
MKPLSAVPVNPSFGFAAFKTRHLLFDEAELFKNGRFWNGSYHYRNQSYFSFQKPVPQQFSFGTVFGTL